MTCIVCKNKTDKFDSAFGAGFCESAYCIEQMELGWGTMENARLFYRLLWNLPDGTPRDTPHNIIPGLKPASKDYYTRVDAVRYKK